MQVVDILRDDQNFANVIALEFRQSEVGFIRICINTIRPTHVVKLVDATWISCKSTCVGKFRRIELIPQASLVTKCTKSAFGRWLCCRSPQGAGFTRGIHGVNGLR